MSSGQRNADLNVANWQIELMTLLPSGTSKRGKTVDELMADLLANPRRICQTDKERKALRRKVQKTLKLLADDMTWGQMLVSEVDGPDGLVERTEETRLKSYWRWKDSNNTLIFPPPNEHACLALLMVEKRLKEEMPPATLEYLQPHFDDAKRRIQQFGGSGNRHSKWQQKIVNQSPTQVLKPSKTLRAVHDAVLQALFEGCQLRLRYLKLDSEQTQSYQLSPLGLVMRGPVTYLIACKISDDPPSAATGPAEQMFALHRIRHAEVLEGSKASVPRGVSFENFIERGGADFVIGELASGQRIQLEVNVSAHVARRLAETPLADQQTLTPLGSSDQYRLSASLPITLQLGWWLLAFGPRIEVLSPPALRAWIASEHLASARRYQSPD